MESNNENSTQESFEAAVLKDAQNFSDMIGNSASAEYLAEDFLARL